MLPNQEDVVERRKKQMREEIAKVLGESKISKFDRESKRLRDKEFDEKKRSRKIAKESKQVNRRRR